MAVTREAPLILLALVLLATCPVSFARLAYVAPDGKPFDVDPNSFGLTDEYPERLRKLDRPVRPYEKPPKEVKRRGGKRAGARPR